MRPFLPLRTPALAWLLLAAVAAAPSLARAEADLSASIEPPRIPIGQDARLVVRVSGVASAPTPRIPPVDGLDVQSLGQTMSMQFVDGAMTTEVTHTFLVRPSRTGRFEIPPISMTVGGDPVSSDRLRLEVVDAGGVPTKPAPPSAGGVSGKRDPPRSGASDPRAASRPGRGDEPPVALLEIEGLPDRELFVGEVVPVDIRLYVREGTRVTEATPPSLVGSGFTLTRPSEGEPRQERIRLEGGLYTRLTFPAAVSPVTAGEVPLAASIDLTARVPRRVPRDRGRFGDPFFDSFFDSFAYQAVEEKVPVVSDERRMRVASLPEEGRPATFSGGIGRFTLTARAEPTEVAVGDPVTVEAEVSGRGSFDRLELPMVQESDDWKTYDPSAEFTPADALGLSGRKTFEQAALPLDPDVEKLPPLVLSYFDPETRRYETVEAPPIELSVEASTAARRPSAAAAVRGPLAAHELAPNKIQIGPLHRSLEPIATRPAFLALQTAPLVLLAAALWWGRRRRHLALDPWHARDREVRETLRVLGRRMDGAVAAGDAGSFFEAARHALQERLAGIDGRVAARSLTLLDIDRRLADRPELRERVRDLFGAADALAYGGAAHRAEELARCREEVRALLDALASRRTA